MDTQLTVSLKTQAEILFARFSGHPFLYHRHLTIQLDHLLIVTSDTRQPLIDPSVHVNPIFFFKVAPARDPQFPSHTGHISCSPPQTSTGGLAVS